MLKTVIDLLAPLAMGVISCVLVWRGRDGGKSCSMETAEKLSKVLGREIIEKE